MLDHVNMQSKSGIDAQLVNSLVESSNASSVYSPSVLLGCTADEVKVSGQKPGTVNLRHYLTQTVQEDVCVPVVGGCINIGDGEAQVRHRGGKHSGQRVPPSDEGLQGKGVGVPGGQDPSPRTGRAQAVEGCSESRGEESVGFVSCDIVQFCFLETADGRRRGGNSITYNITFLRVAETTNVPRHHGQAPKMFIHCRSRAPSYIGAGPNAVQDNKP